MKTLCGLCLTSLIVFSLFTFAQQPTAKSPSATNVYTNDALGLTWEYPKNWVAQKEPGEPPKGSRMTVLLDLATPNGDSVGLVSEDYRDTPGFGVHYSDSMKDMLQKQGWEPVGERRRRTLGGGVQAVEDRFKSNTSPANYLSLICGDFRGYELKFMIESGSAEGLDQIAKTLDQITIKPDWSSAESAADASSASKVKVSWDVLQSSLSKGGQPDYPPEALEKKIQGQVVMTVHVNTAGHVQDIYVVEGNPILVSAALKSVSQWEFKPYLLDGQPANVESQVVLTLAPPKK